MVFDFFRVQSFFGLKTAKSFQCARPLQGAPGAENEKKNRPVLNENIFCEAATEKEIHFFSIFFEQNVFVSWGPELPVPRPLQKPVNRDSLEKLR